MHLNIFVPYSIRWLREQARTQGDRFWLQGLTAAFSFCGLPLTGGAVPRVLLEMGLPPGEWLKRQD